MKHKIEARVYLVGQMLSALFSGGWSPHDEEVRLRVVTEAVRTADIAMGLLAVDPRTEEERKQEDAVNKARVWFWVGRNTAGPKTVTDEQFEAKVKEFRKEDGA